MKIRNDSPFAQLTEEQIDKLLHLSETMTLDDLVKVVAGAPQPIHCTIPTMSRFLKKARADKMLRGFECKEESIEAFAKRGESPKVREAALAVMRDRMLDVTLESNHADRLMEVFAALNAEKEKEKALELEERKVKAAESNANVAQRRLELEAAKSGVKLLPRIREMLMDTSRPLEERVAGTLAFMSTEGGRLLAAGAPVEEQPMLRALVEPPALPAPCRTED